MLEEDVRIDIKLFLFFVQIDKDLGKTIKLFLNYLVYYRKIYH